MMRHFVMIAVGMALATAQTGAVAAPTRPVQNTAFVAAGQTGTSVEDDRRRRRTGAIIMSLAALSALLLGIIAATNHHGGGGRPASP